MTQNQPTKTKSVAEIGEAIPHELAAKMVKDYDSLHGQESSTRYTIGKNIIEKMLAQPGCEGIRFFNGIEENGEKTLVYVGVDANSRPLIEYTVVGVEGELKTMKAMAADRTDKGSGSSSWFD